MLGTQIGAPNGKAARAAAARIASWQMLSEWQHTMHSLNPAEFPLDAAANGLAGQITTRPKPQDPLSDPRPSSGCGRRRGTPGAFFALPQTGHNINFKVYVVAPLHKENYKEGPLKLFWGGHQKPTNNSPLKHFCKPAKDFRAAAAAPVTARERQRGIMAAGPPCP
jgi:hypothetical protein